MKHNSLCLSNDKSKSNFTDAVSQALDMSLIQWLKSYLWIYAAES